MNRYIDQELLLKFDTSGCSVKLKEDTWSDLEIAGRDGKFHTAKASLNGNIAIISSDSVADPCYLRYGWKEVFEPSVFNETGLPASPFAIKLESNGQFSLIKKEFDVFQKPK